MTGPSPRHRARELVLQALYALSVTEDQNDETVGAIIKDDTLSDKALGFARALYDTVRRNRDWADSTIQSLAENWRLERLAQIDRSILQMALVEMKESPDVPFKAVINEALELAKTFSTADSAAFINGILDSFVKRMTDSPAT